MDTRRGMGIERAGCKAAQGYVQRCAGRAAGTPAASALYQHAAAQLCGAFQSHGPSPERQGQPNLEPGAQRGHGLHVREHGGMGNVEPMATSGSTMSNLGGGQDLRRVDLPGHAATRCLSAREGGEAGRGRQAENRGQ